MIAELEQVQTTNRCSKCAIGKGLECFFKDKNKRFGVSNQCKSCVKQYRNENRDRLLKGYRNVYLKRKADPVIYKKLLQDAYQRNRLSQSKYPHKVKARSAVTEAIASGKLIRPSVCSSCSKACKPEAHHDSYDQDKRLDVRWLCKQCHETHHSNL